MASTIEDVLARAEQEEAEKLKSITVVKELDLEFDIGNLLALDKNRLDVRDFRGQKKEEFLRALARDNTQLLVNELWKLPTERVDEVIVVKLPHPTTRLPREKPAPKPRPPTKWEEFAKLKGIQKKRKTNLVWDEVAKEWKRRYGFKRAKDNTKEWLIEVPVTADPNEDQFQKRNAAKKERVAKNELNRLRNIARAHKIKLPGVGLAPTEGDQLRSKADLVRAGDVAMSSTASRGQFQDRLPKEKPRRPAAGKKRKFLPLIGDFSGERQKQLDLLKTMDSKRPRIDVTKAVNKQMREDDREEAAARYKKGGRGGRGGRGRGGGKPRGGGGRGGGGARGRAMGGRGGGGGGGRGRGMGGRGGGMGGRGGGMGGRGGGGRGGKRPGP